MKDGPYSVAENEKHLASFFVAASEQLAKSDKPIPAQITRRYSNENFEAFGLLCFALHDWAIGDAENASEIFTSFLSAKLRPAHFPGRRVSRVSSDSWINELKPMAADYAFDCYRVAEVEKDLATVTDGFSARALAERVRTAQDELKRGGKLSVRLKSIETELIVKGATP